MTCDKTVFLVSTIFDVTSWFLKCNKKVLLRERKRHTARCVANTRYVVLTGYPPGGGTRSGTPPPPGGVPSQVPPPGGVSGYPPGGYPVRYPPGGYPVRYPPRGGTRTPRGVPGQVPPGGVPGPPLPPLWTDKHLWKQYLPVVLRTRAVKMWISSIVIWQVYPFSINDKMLVIRPLICIFRKLFWRRFSRSLYSKLM